MNNETLTKVTADNGQTYMFLSNEDTMLQSELTGMGAEMYEIMKETQPERFQQMKANGTLIPYLDMKGQTYYQNMEIACRNEEMWNKGIIQIDPLKVPQAHEICRQQLLEDCGLI